MKTDIRWRDAATWDAAVATVPADATDIYLLVHWKNSDEEYNGDVTLNKLYPLSGRRWTFSAPWASFRTDPADPTRWRRYAVIRVVRPQVVTPPV